MEASIIQPAVLFAFFGALAIKLLELAELPKIHKSQRPDFKDWIYWVPFFVLPFLGAGLAYVYVMSGIDLKPILAVNVGVSAPLILRAMAEVNPLQGSAIDPGQGA
jgi:hypothetical protein